MPSSTQIVFPPFRLDLANECLWSDTESIPLTRKAFAVLRHLAERPGRLVKKEELLDAVWPETHVGEGVLKVAVAEIRKALNDVSSAPSFIETAHRRGYRFIGEIPGEEPGSAPTGMGAVERESSLLQLRAWMDKALDGERQVVFITGETGIGKTTLVESFLEGAMSNPAVWVAQGQCLEHFAEGEPYFPVLEALGRLCRQPGRESLVDLLRRHAPTWLAQMPSLVKEADREALKRETMGAAKERMLREIAEVIEALTADTPLILVLEDLHWSDYSTVDLIGHLARRRGPARLLIAGTFRPAEVIVKQHPLRELKRELQVHRRCSELALELLSEAAVAKYIHQRFPNHRLPETLSQFLHGRTDGNPLFLVNVVDFLVSQGRIARKENVWALTIPLDEVEIGIPDSLQQLIETQIEQLSEDERRLLSVGSVAGLEFSTRTLGGGLDSSLSAIEVCCERLVKRGQFLRTAQMIPLLDGSLLERYGFTHGLYQHVFYRNVPHPRRVTLHRRLGEFQEQAFSDHLDEIAAELAVHFEEGRDYPKAIQYLRLSAMNASGKRHANREAMEHLGRALDLLKHIPERERAALEGAILEERGTVLRTMDDNESAAADFERVAVCARSAGRTEWEVKALLKLSAVLFWTDHDRSLAVSERAVELSAKSGNAYLHSQARGYCASRRIRLQGWRDEDFEDVVEAMEAARAAGDLGYLGLHTMTYSFFESFRSQHREACEAADRGIAIAIETSDAFLYISCQYFKAWALLHAGKWGETLDLVREGVLLSEKNGHGTAVAVLRMIEARLHALAFDFAGARDIAREVLRFAREGFPRFIALIGLGEAQLGLGEFSQALECFEEVTQRSQAGPFRLDSIFHLPLYRGLAELYLAQGDLVSATAYAQRLCGLAAKPSQLNYLGIGYQLLTEIALAQKDLALAGSWIGKAMETMDEAEAPLARSRILHTASRLRAAEGRTDEAATLRTSSVSALAMLAESMRPGEPLRKSVLRGLEKAASSSI